MDKMVHNSIGFVNINKMGQKKINGRKIQRATTSQDLAINMVRSVIIASITLKNLHRFFFCQFWKINQEIEKETKKLESIDQNMNN